MQQQASGIVESGFFSVTSTNASFDVGGLVLDSSDNIFVASRVSGCFTGIKLNASGSFVSRFSLLNSGLGGGTVSLDSNNNVLFAAAIQSRNAAFIKTNSSLAIQIQRSIADNETADNYRTVLVDSSNNIYGVGNINNLDVQGDVFLTKYSSAGSFQFAKAYRRTSGQSNIRDSAGGAAINPSNEIFTFGDAPQGGLGGTDFLLTKINSAGSLIFAKVIGGSGSESNVNAQVAFHNGHVYAAGQTRSAGPSESNACLMKISETGVLQWTRVLGKASFDQRPFGVAVDSQGNVFVYCDNQETQNQIFLAKYNSSGTIEYQRTLTSNARLSEGKIAIDSLDNIVLTLGLEARLNGSNDNFVTVVAKLPNSGGLTGTYSVAGKTLTYAESSFSLASPSFSTSNLSLTTTSLSLSRFDNNEGLNNTTLTTTVQEI